ncbi:MAG: efflux RND transporter periplasmic adaptor subunit [Pseudomonadota bacterium]
MTSKRAFESHGQPAARDGLRHDAVVAGWVNAPGEGSSSRDAPSSASPVVILKNDPASADGASQEAPQTTQAPPVKPAGKRAAQDVNAVTGTRRDTATAINAAAAAPPSSAAAPNHDGDGETRSASGDDPPAQPPRKRRHPIVSAFRFLLQLAFPVAIIFGGLAGYNWLKATKPEPPKRAATERAFTARTMIAKRGTYAPQLELYGTVVAGRQVDIRALVAGRVVSTAPALREGGQVTADTKILAIDRGDYVTSLNQLQAQLAEAKAKLKEQQASEKTERSSLAYARQQLKLSRTDLNRAVPLARRGTVSKRTVDDRRQTLLGRQQTVDQLRNNLAVWKARQAQQRAIIKRFEASVEQAQRRVAETTLKAPFDAYVSEVAAQVGRMMSANDKVATLIDRRWIEVRFTLNDTQYGRLISAEADKALIGQSIDIAWNIGRTPVRYEATIDRVAARVSSGSGGVEVFARVKAPLQPVPLRPGAFVRVKMDDARYTDVMRLPDTALYGGNTVYEVVDGRLRPRKVEVIGAVSGDIFIRGDVEPGARVLTSRLSTPGPGVRINEEQPAATPQASGGQKPSAPRSALPAGARRG